ncbi:type I restriction enzyme, S subunit [Celeribacter baekdonensis]|uniref:Type I restriction enzyme, S subunit n=1 Tax=Celeribacter baekdonensis TaxID=875171 RepID=A0A1G7H284_9RHOB|nr:restriction endonuclease subunit S [Celeribacter baekdonensis]SDE94552.1 type I restriction enzyme, S subunit [Celeribacter baekdonensis]
MSETNFPEGPIGTFVAAQVGGGTPSRQNPGFWNGPIPWASVKDFDEGQIELNETDEYITQKGLTASATNLIPANTPIVCTRMAVGRVALAPMDVAINQDLKALFPTSSTDTRYLLRLADYAKPRAEAVSVGSTVKGIKVADYLNIQVPLAPPPHQSKIAEILDTLDAAIRGTEAVVAKLKAMKQGLLHDLLTRGIDANGDLRPPHPEAPHLYKQTPLGWLPKGWDWGRLADYCSRICVGIVIRPADHYVDEGVPTFRSANVREGYISESDFVYISAASNALLHKSQIRKGDILTVRTGYPGTSAVVPEKYNGCNCVDILISTPLNSVSSEFLCSWINSPFGKGQVLSGQGGLAQQHFNVGEMRELIVVKPLKAEQEEITSKIDAAEVRIQTEQNLLAKLRLQKSGLMDDLLTGRTLVTALL